MYGPAPSIDNGNNGVRITVRVLLSACAVLTCGMLSCVPLFRIAFLRRRWWDWALAGLSVPLGVGCIAVVGSVPETDHRGDWALGAALVLAVASVAYYLAMDVRLPYAAPRQQPVPGPYFSPQTTLGQYGPYQPYADTVPVVPAPQPQTQPQQPVPPPRIDQVRAELDELSDLLRKKPDGREGQGR
ncbi:hypothetical protein [Streptomyces sp. NBC_01465]|uniref:hypothetical protein n=1 Tax=Streptomyces sp. NBC_01465 TaxID=2903878 RepID=UPI002E30E2C0|nr:hypothetical protein [Streptomyces sp. NBC_01465]